MPDDSLEARTQRLTPREWRVVALVIEGLTTEQACEALGVAPGTFESHKQAIRRKLAVQRGQRLEAFLREHLSALPIPPQAAEPEVPPPVRGGPPAQAEAAEDRRIRWLLRVTLKELQEVSGSAALRAELLEQTVRRMGAEDSADASREVAELKYIASELAKTYHRLLEDIRSGAVG